MTDLPISRVQPTKLTPPVRRADVVPDSKAIRPEEQQAANPSRVHSSGARAPVSRAESAPKGLASLESLLPIAILSNPSLMRAEWGWRKLVTERMLASLATRQSETPAELDSHASSDETQVFLERGIRLLWDALQQWTAGPEPETKGSVTLPRDTLDQLSNAVADQPASVIPFAKVRPEHMTASAPHRLSAWVLADRVVSAVRSLDAPLTGAGMFILGPSISNDGGAVVRWEAERHTRIGAHGSLVHRLTIRVVYEDHPVLIQLVCARPSLYVHLATSHYKLRERLANVPDDLRGGLATAGWRIDGWTVAEQVGEAP